ncbi:MAG: hypothetical protein NUV45_06105 [Tepidanaerobacteraceae bacterium]|nr:hypothetical protein [Tepidanaerobacteraceae bacterium]
MDINRAKFIRIAAITCISLIIMLTAQWIYTKITIEKSLASTILQKPWIEKVEIKNDLGKVMIFISFKDTDNFMEAYDNLYETINYNLKGKPFSIVIINEPDITLKEAYENSIQFVIYEAVKTGNYTEMKKKLDEVSSLKKINIQSYINHKNVYLKLKHGNHYFYCVIEK